MGAAKIWNSNYTISVVQRDITIIYLTDRVCIKYDKLALIKTTKKKIHLKCINPIILNHILNLDKLLHSDKYYMPITHIVESEMIVYVYM